MHYVPYHNIKDTTMKIQVNHLFESFYHPYIFLYVQTITWIVFIILKNDFLINVCIIHLNHCNMSSRCSSHWFQHPHLLEVACKHASFAMSASACFWTVLYVLHEKTCWGFSFSLIGHPKAMSLSNHAQQKAVFRQKVELTPDFSEVDTPPISWSETEMGLHLEQGLDPPLQWAKVRHRWDWSTQSQSGP